MAEHQVNYASGLPVVLTSVDKLVQWGEVILCGLYPTDSPVARSR